MTDDGTAMVVIEDAWCCAESLGPSVVTIGNFDGIHIGQQAILQRLAERGQATGLESIMVTFEPHPQVVLRPTQSPLRLTTRDQKRTLVERLGVGAIAEVGFDESFAKTTAEDFVETFLHGKLRVSEVYVGSRFVFGRRREGDVQLLRKLGRALDFEVFGVEEVAYGGAPVSSTRIRRAIQDGDVADGGVMLGRAYSIYGSVVRGDGRGKTLGWPTINVATAHEVLPGDGVYASKAWLPELARMFDAVTNVGSRPTFPNGEPKVVESHLFDFDGEIYDKRVELCFLARLRGEQAFPSADALTSQIEKDAGRAREYLQQENGLDFLPTIGD